VSELDPNCHPKLNELIMHCVELDPNDRPESMGYVCDRLQLILGMLRAARSKGGQTAGSLMDPGASRADSRAGSSSAVKPDSNSASTSVLGVRVPESKQ
jgi:hypothetical protein